MDYAEAMKAQGFVKITLWIDCSDDRYSYDEEQELWVQPTGSGSFIIKESSGFFDSYQLYFGDEIIVETLGDLTCRFKSVVSPSPMCHFFGVGGGAPQAMTKELHALGGEWETEMGRLTTLHLPRRQLNAFRERFGLTLCPSEEIFSGLQHFDLPEKSSKAVEQASGSHVVLLGDSIFDNGAYVPDGPSVIDQLRTRIPDGMKVTLVARDGDCVCHVAEQLRVVPLEASHLVLSIGGNDALNAIERLSSPADTVRNALSQLNAIRENFSRAYRHMLKQVLALKRPTAVCTIYDAVPKLSGELKTALCLFNDTIVREALATGLDVIDLRHHCTSPTDYSEISPIEPSEQGGEKIAKAIARWLKEVP